MTTPPVLKKNKPTVTFKKKSTEPKKSKVPLAIGAAFMLIAAAIGFFVNDIKVTLFSVVTGLALMQACLDCYEGTDKKIWSVVTRIFIIFAGAMVLYVSKI